MRRSGLVVLVALTTVAVLLTGVCLARELTFEDRVNAQKAIEQVLWNHRIWPKENPGVKPPLSAVMSDEAIRAKVEDYLRKSNALEKWWQRPITADQLQAELDRMAKNTRDPGMLQEMFKALGNDPGLIAETLARQTLADRLIHNWYASDARLHGEVKARAEAALSVCASVSCMKSMGGNYKETTWTLDEGRADAMGDGAGAPHDPAGGSEGVLRNQPAGSADSASSAISEGDTSVHRGSRAADAEATGGGQVDAMTGRADRAICADEGGAGTAADAGGERVAAGGSCVEGAATRSKHDAEVPLDPDQWTTQLGQLATELGGVAESLPVGQVSRLEETADAFLVTAVLSQDRTRIATATTVWPKRSFDAWWALEGTAIGSRVEEPTGSFSLPDLLVAGCTNDTWSPTPYGLPDARYGHTAVWTGSEMIVWGGVTSGIAALSAGGRYNPSTDTWTPTSRGTDLPAGRNTHTAVWTGTEMIVWGGYGSATYNTGGRYNPSADSWRPTSLGANVPTARNRHTAVWTGTEMIVWGGYDGANYLNTGGRYNPSTDSWKPTSLGTNVPAVRYQYTAVWTGTEMIVWGGYDSVNYLNTGGRYDPSADTWAATSTGANVPVARAGQSAVWTGTEMVVWGGYGSGTGYLNTGGRYNPSTNVWRSTSTGANVPSGRDQHTAAWTGMEMIVWGGYDGSAWFNTGGRYNPTSDTWAATSTGANVPSGRDQHTAVWSGTEMIVWGGTASSGFFDSGGRYNPATDTWIATPNGLPVPTGRATHSAVWTGVEMIVWGGHSASSSALNTGGRYDPFADNWTPTSTGTDVPAARDQHTAVWTGTEMIVWGGYSGLNTGGRYNPSTNTWTATSTGTNVPAGRYLHTAVWTGTEMIVWGGYNSSFLNTGGRYNPTTNSWTGTSTATNVPTARQYHVAVWSGTEMIVWGGYGGGYLNTGGRYNPSTNSWAATSTGTNVPIARQWHSAVWSGTEMIVWGGYNPSSLNTGGRYNPATNAWTATSTGTNVPAARSRHTAAWTGTEMIVWGGYTSQALDTGGRYNPSTDNWTATSTGENVPSGRDNHSAVYTGTEMIVWGGRPSTSTGGRYCGCANSLVWYRDADGDGYGNPAVWTATCGGSAPSGYVGNSSDCNDTNPAINPGGSDANCDGIDNNCNGQADEGYVGVTTSCGIGACHRTALTSCVAGHVVDNCVPGSPSMELCNAIDDDCDGTIDNASPPGVFSSVLASKPAVGSTTVTLSWSPAFSSTAYDIVRGRLSDLKTTGGNFTVATQACLGNNVSGTSIQDTSGTGLMPRSWYLIRAINCGGVGTYDEGGSQQGLRDAEINAAPAACP